MKMKCNLIIRENHCELEFDFEKHTYQDACCLYQIGTDGQDELLRQTADNQLFNDFRELIFADYDYENGIESARSKKRNEYLKKITEYIENGGDESIEVKRID